MASRYVPNKDFPVAPPPTGNRRAVKHGVHAEPLPEVLDAKLQAVYDALAAAAPVRGADGDVYPADRFAVLMLAKVLCRLEAASAYLDKRGAWDARGRVRSVARHELRLMGKAEKLMAQLGMTPTARAKLGLDIARSVSLAEAMSEPDPKRRRQLLMQAGLEDDGGGRDA